MATTFATHLTAGTHAARPAASALPAGALYSCSTHSKLEQTDGATWTDYFAGAGAATGTAELLYMFYNLR